MSLAISSAGSGLPSRVIMHGVEGVGKSSFGAHAPKPIFLMTRGEQGLLSLIDNGRVSETDHFDELTTWLDVLQAVRHLTVHDTGHKSLVLDTLNGAERLCHEHVCAKQFNGSWEGFAAFGKGPEASLAEWIKLFTELDSLRARKRMAIVCLAHTKVKTFKNPEGDDYDRYTPDMHEKGWGVACKWADVVLFANYETFAKKAKNENKAKGFASGRRLLYTQRTAAWDAKNRVGLPEEIEAGDGADGGFRAFASAMKKARDAGKAAGALPAPQPESTPSTEEKVGA